jgi:hypothetical protein
MFLRSGTRCFNRYSKFQVASISSKLIGSSNRFYSHNKSNASNWSGRIARMLAISAIAFLGNSADNTTTIENNTSNIPSNGNRQFPLISAQQIRDMVEKEDKIVVVLFGSVYDVSKFTGHPGGVGRLQMAAGGDLEVFWRVYTQHNRGHIEFILDRYKIGEVTPEDAKIIKDGTHFDNPYLNDPPPSPHLLTNTRYPYNAEARLSTLTDNFITPIGKHFVRNHGHVPDIKPEDYKLTVLGEGLKETSFTLNDLKTKFEKVNITTVIQCNGNRREDFHYLDGKTPAFGPPHWVAGAIGCSTWSGVRMRDLFKASGIFIIIFYFLSYFINIYIFV